MLFRRKTDKVPHALFREVQGMRNARIQPRTSNPVLSFLMCHINYHIERHLYPGVPCYHLPKVHKILEEEFQTAGSSVYTSYRSFLSDVGKAVVEGVVSNRHLIPEHIREHVCV